MGICSKNDLKDQWEKNYSQLPKYPSIMGRLIVLIFQCYDFVIPNYPYSLLSFEIFWTWDHKEIINLKSLFFYKLFTYQIIDKSVQCINYLFDI